MCIETLKSVLKSRQKRLQSKQAENELLLKQVKEQEDKCEVAVKNTQITNDALEFLEGIANSRREQMKGKIESVLTEALQLVYGSDRRIELTYSVKNFRSDLAIEIIKDTVNGEVRRVLDGSGAGLGVSDTISVPLRLLVMLGDNTTDKICLLDECYKHVDIERVPVVTAFLKVLTERLGIQVLMLSHHESIRDEADACYEVMVDQNGMAQVNRR